MGKLEKHQEIVKQILSKQAEYEPSNMDLETILILDGSCTNYQIMYVGWHNSRRTHGTLIHVRVKEDGKIWIEYDGSGGLRYDLGIYTNTKTPPLASLHATH